MRKIFALLLTVIMLASALAAVPAFAATTAGGGTYDGTTKDIVNRVLITEIGYDMSYKKVADAKIAKVMNFVEIYNNGDTAMNLDTLSLLLGVEIEGEDGPEDGNSPYLSYRNGDTSRPLWKEWTDHKLFISEMEIKNGPIVDLNTALNCGASEVYEYLTNEEVSLASGESAIIWFVTANTINWLITAADGETIEGFVDPKTEFLRNYYGDEVDPDDYNVVMVWAYSEYTQGDNPTLAKDMFNFDSMPVANEMNKDFIIGVAHNSWNVDIDKAYDADEETIHQDLYSMSILGDEIAGYTYYKEQTAIYAPSMAKPFVQNAYESFIERNNVYDDYFDAGLVRSYRENGVISWTCAAPTPGQIPDWHQAMIDSAKGDISAQQLAAIEKEIRDTYKYYDDGTNAGRDESGLDREYNLESQEDIKNRFNKKKKNTDTVDEGGLPTWALILIIVGGVLVVAGGACAVVFLVILPKKKAAAAAAAVAAPVEEAPAEDAPVEDAPVEDAPAEESKDE